MKYREKIARAKKAIVALKEGGTYEQIRAVLLKEGRSEKETSEIIKSTKSIGHR